MFETFPAIFPVANTQICHCSRRKFLGVAVFEKNMWQDGIAPRAPVVCQLKSLLLFPQVPSIFQRRSLELYFPKSTYGMVLGQSTNTRNSCDINRGGVGESHRCSESIAHGLSGFVTRWITFAKFGDSVGRPVWFSHQVTFYSLDISILASIFHPFSFFIYVEPGERRMVTFGERTL